MREKSLVAIIIILALMAAIASTFLILTWEEEEVVRPEPPPGDIKVMSSTAVKFEFSYVEPLPRPTDLLVTLEMNGTYSGTYSFKSDDDHDLIFESGADICKMEYVDLADNQKVNVGDVLKMTELSPGSAYVLKLTWASTSDEIVTRTFHTPTG